MINQVQKELIKKHIGPFLFCFFTIMFVLLMQFLMMHVENLVGKGLEMSIIFELIFTNLAYMVVLAVPMAVLVSTLIAFGKFSEWNELTAVRAAGVNPIRLMTPILTIGVILFIGTTYFSNYILPEANHKARSLFIDIRLAKPGFDLQEGSFYDGIEGYTFLVKNIDSENDTLRDVTVFQEPKNNRNRAFIRAERGWLESEDEQTLTLMLYDGSILRYLPGEYRNDETVESSNFQRYRMSFDLSDLEFSRANPDSRSRNDRTMSAQAMIVVVDSIRADKEKEYQSLVKRQGQDEYMPFRVNSATTFKRMVSETDSVAPSESYFQVLRLLENAAVQLNLIDLAISTLNTHRADLETFNSNIGWRDFRIAEFMVEVHKKFSIPFACVLFVMIGAPIGMLTRKGNIGLAAIIAIVILTLYFMAIIQGEKWADRMVISPFLGMWGINILLFIVGSLLMIHVCSSARITNLLISDE